MTVLFVVATIVLFLGIDWGLRRIKAGKAVSLAPVTPERPFEPQAAMAVRAPEGMFFARSHTWLNLFPSGKVRLGLDDFVGRLLEKPEITYLKHEGEPVKKGERILILTEGTRSLTVRSPIDGTILSRNEELTKNPELMKEQLFSDGWAYAIKPQKSSDLKSMLLGEETRSWMRTEFGRLRDVFAGVGTNSDVLPALLQDGGAPVSGALKGMDEAVWKKFEQTFLEIQ
ncbi:MAG: glycine cleavage system protein H [Bacteroidota bacterium]